MQLSEEVVRELLNKLLDFLEPVHSLARAYLGSFFTENLWDLVPINIQEELNNVTSLDDFIQVYSDIVKNSCPSDFAKKHPHVLKFIKTAINLSILKQDNFLSDVEDLLSVKNYPEKQIHLISPVMTKKKLHEVETAARVTGLLSNHTRSCHIVDVGAGKGYLSSILALNYKCNVLGLEISQQKTCSAVKRSKLIAQNIKDGNGNVKLTKAEQIQGQFKQAVAAVEADTNISTLVKEHFVDVGGITLTGLHTCGNLSPACLQIFLDEEEIKGILNIGCCYHFISEEFSDDAETEKTNARFGFPMSLYLKKRKCVLGRNARMLSAHSVDRIKTELGVTQTSLLHRAILETVLKGHKDSPTERNMTKLPKKVNKCEDFHEYLQQSLKHLNLTVQLTDENIKDLFEKYKDKKSLLTAFFLLRVTLAPVVESIILLDRMLYLIENGISNAHLVRLFNLETSPRGFGIIAWKDR